MSESKSELKRMCVMNPLKMAERMRDLEQQLTAEREAREKAERKYNLAFEDNLALERKVSAEKQRAESAEQRNREAMEQEPVAYTHKGIGFISVEYARDYQVDVSEMTKLYAAPIPPADAKWFESLFRDSEGKREAAYIEYQKLQRETAELTRKLDAHKNCHRCSGNGITHHAECPIYSAEINATLLEEAKRQAVPEGCIVGRDFRYDVFTELHTPTITIFFPAGKGEDNLTWKVRDDFAAMLSAAPKPDAAIRVKGN